MSEAPDLTKYFKNDGPDLFNFGYKALSQNESKENLPEPIICNLFKDLTPPTEAATFFDTFGSAGPSSLDNSGLNKKDEDLLAFSKLKISEGDRSHDAWIPSDKTRSILVSKVTSGSFVVDKKLLTMPGVVIEEDLKDAVYETVHHYLGPSEAAKRKVSKAQDLRELMSAGHYRVAINLTKVLLGTYGQGVGAAGTISRHTVPSLQLWFTRLSLLIKIGSCTFAEVEAEPFGDLDKPDLYFQFYPELYGARTGSMVPFKFRLLLAQLPMYTGKQVVAINRLYRLLATIQKMIDNLEKGLLEDGTPCELSLSGKEEALKIWEERENNVLHSLVNCALSFKDYSLAIELMQTLLKKTEKNSAAERTLNAALGRILLQMGDIFAAENLLHSIYNGIPDDVDSLSDMGLLSLSRNEFKEAQQYFEKALHFDRNNIMVLNNIAICLLYSGRLKDAIALLEESIGRIPEIALQEDFLLNLTCLYELQSVDSTIPKKRLLSLVNLHRGDSFNVACLKLT